MKHCYPIVVAALLFAQAALAQAPTITSLNPARNARAVHRSSNVSVTFSQPVSSGSAGALRVFSSQRGGRLTGAASVSGSTLSFDPARDLRVGEEVSVTIPTTIQSSAGTALAAPQVYRFRVGAVGGTGVFDFTGTTVAVGTRARDIVTADVDGDGDLDLLAATQLSNTISVRLNNGAGTFGAGSDVAVGTAPYAVAAADVDGDGDLDLLSANHSSASVSLRLNAGNGVFSGSTGLSVSANPSGIKTADVDGDGDLDILTISDDAPGILTVLLNNGTGTFAAGSTVALTKAFSKNLVVVDIDNDGDLDVLVNNNGFDAGTNTSAVSVLRNNGSGVFSGSTTITVGPSPEDIAVADIDNDGDMDLLTPNYVSSSVSVRLNDGAGNYTGTTEVPLPFQGASLTVSDIDGDGDGDLVAGSGGGISIHYNNGSGVFGSGTLYPEGGNYRVTTADVDGDGDLDMLTASGDVGVRINNGRGAPLPARAGQLAAQLAVWPNPAREAIQVSGAAARQPVQLLDSLGRLILSGITDQSGNASLRLPASVSPGLYLLKTPTSASRVLIE